MQTAVGSFSDLLDRANRGPVLAIYKAMASGELRSVLSQASAIRRDMSGLVSVMDALQESPVSLGRGGRILGLELNPNLKWGGRITRAVPTNGQDDRRESAPLLHATKSVSFSENLETDRISTSSRSGGSGGSSSSSSSSDSSSSSSSGSSSSSSSRSHETGGLGKASQPTSPGSILPVEWSYPDWLPTSHKLLSHVGAHGIGIGRHRNHSPRGQILSDVFFGTQVRILGDMYMYSCIRVFVCACLTLPHFHPHVYLLPLHINIIPSS